MSATPGAGPSGEAPEDDKTSQRAGDTSPGQADPPAAPDPAGQTDRTDLPDSAQAQEPLPANADEAAVPDAAASSLAGRSPTVEATSGAGGDGDAGSAPAPASAATAAPASPTSGNTPAAETPAVQAPTATELAVGAVVADRFTVLRPLALEAAAELLGRPAPQGGGQLYAVEDRDGYERCWSCGSSHNDKKQRFCVDCGAPQRREAVLMQTPAATGEPDEFVDAGQHYHVLHPRKQFGSAGVSLEVGAHSAEGPHHPNEDSYWTGVIGGCYDSRCQGIGVFALADGMGGYAPGSGLISRMIVEHVGRGVFGSLVVSSEVTPSEDELQAHVRSAIADANVKVLDEIRQHGDMGATLVMGVICGEMAWVANIGDSRAYYISPSQTVTQITRDQSLVEQQVGLGLLGPDAAYTAQGNNVILHAVGEEGVENEFDWYPVPLEPGSYLMLCTDGYWKTMRHAVWDSQAAAGASSLLGLTRSLVETALGHNSDDNTTVLLVSID